MSAKIILFIHLIILFGGTAAGQSSAGLNPNDTTYMPGKA